MASTPTRASSPTRARRSSRTTATAWDKYLTLTDKPDDTVAALMVQAFGTSGLNQPAEAVSAMEIIVDNRPATGPLYVQLAALAYEAGQTRKADLASKKALVADAQGRPRADQGPARRRPPVRLVDGAGGDLHAVSVAAGRARREAAPATTSSLSCPTPPL